MSRAMGKEALPTSLVDFPTSSALKHKSLLPSVSRESGLSLQHVLILLADAVLSFATISLGLKVPRMKDSRRQQVAAIIWASVVFGMYSFLMSLFRIKNGGYPFWLPPF